MAVTELPTAELVMFQAMERKRPYVSFGILLVLFEPLLEITFFPEAVLLRHLLFLFFGLHDPTLVAEAAHLAVKHLIATELTLQRAVVDRNLDAGFQADLPEALLTIRQDPCLIAHELVFQPFADHLVGSQQVRCGDTLSIRRIHHDDALLLRLREVLEVLLGDGHIPRQAGGGHIHTCRVHGLHVGIVAVDVMGELTFL